MPEANGELLFKIPHALQQQFDPDEHEIARALIAGIFDAAAIVDPFKHAALQDAPAAFAHEGMEVRDGYLVIAPFGDEWMQPLQTLVEYGSGVELYGSIRHEYGYVEFYALDGVCARYFGTIDYDGGGDEEHEQQVIANWRACVPTAVRERFAELFASEEDDLDEAGDHESDDDASSGAEAQRWMPVADDDFVVEIGGIKRLNGDLLNAELYQRAHLVRAHSLGVQLVYTRGGGSLPSSELHYVLSSLEHNVAQKTQIAVDMLDVFAFDLDQVCKGYGESTGTALNLAASDGLFEVVARLLALGADPMRDSDQCALDAARDSLAILPALDDEFENFDEDERNEGNRDDFLKVISLLESAPSS